MHIVFICNEYPPGYHGGTGSSYCDLAEGLTAVGHSVTVVGNYYEKDKWRPTLVSDTKINGVRVVRLRGLPQWLPWKLQFFGNRYKLTQWLKREHSRHPIDIIEASDYDGWLRFGGPSGVATIVRVRGANCFFDAELNREGSELDHDTERVALAKADHIASVSRYAASRTLSLCRLSDRQYTVIPNAVDMDVFSPSSSTTVERGLIVYVNMINPKKGIEQLIDAMNMVFPRYPESKLMVIGQDVQKMSNGKTYVEALKERVEPQYKERVIFAGRMDRHTGVIDNLRRAHICCYPSHMETFGIAVIEAMSIGKPAIFSKTGPGPEVIEDGVSGLLCDPFSAEDIADKICTILANDEYAEELGVNARQRVASLFNKSNWVQRNLEFFQRCVREKSAMIN